MGLTLKYKNNLGTVLMQGGGQESPLRVTGIDGVGLVTREYNTAVYSGYDGQETLGSRTLARSITVAVEVADKAAVQVVRHALDVLSQGGKLYIKDENLERCITCNQVHVTETNRILRGQILTFAVQFICDSPFFEDAYDTVVPLYKRIKLLETPFTLPAMFGEIILGGSIEIKGALSVEPIITIHYPTKLEGTESIVLTNGTTGKSVRLDYAPSADETITIDIKNRKVTSNINGNIINYISRDTFLGDFVLIKGINTISVNVGDITPDFTIECRYNNLYNEAVIV